MECVSYDCTLKLLSQLFVGLGGSRREGVLHLSPVYQVVGYAVIDTSAYIGSDYAVAG